METSRRQFLKVACRHTLVAGSIVLGGYTYFSYHDDRPRDVTIGDLTWRASLDEARTVAIRDGKPILLLNLFGRLDQEFC